MKTEIGEMPYDIVQDLMERLKIEIRKTVRAEWRIAKLERLLHENGIKIPD